MNMADLPISVSSHQGKHAHLPVQRSWNGQEHHALSELVPRRRESASPSLYILFAMMIEQPLRTLPLQILPSAVAPR